MHYQRPPHEEAKLVTCVRGKIYDVIVDLRPASTTYMEYFGLYLSAQERDMLYVPEGFAHGFQTMLDDTEVFYQMTEFYMLEAACGFRWNDPAFGIEWPPVSERIISARDQSYADFATVSD